MDVLACMFDGGPVDGISHPAVDSPESLEDPTDLYNRVRSLRDHAQKPSHYQRRYQGPVAHAANLSTPLKGKEKSAHVQRETVRVAQGRDVQYTQRAGAARGLPLQPRRQ